MHPSNLPDQSTLVHSRILQLPSPDLSRSSPLKISRKLSASELLEAFSPKPSPPKKPQSCLSTSKCEIAMSDARSLRRKEKVSYTVSDDSDVTGSPSGASSTFSPGRKSRRVRKITELSDDELEEIEPPKTPPPRTSSAGHSLRQHKDLHLSLRAQQNGDKPVLKKRKLSRGTQNQQQKDSIRVAAPIPQRTARNEIRDTIASKTAIHRASFFVSKKDYFLPLLPSSNYITKLAEQRSQDGKSEDLTVPYEAITTQPKG